MAGGKRGRFEIGSSEINNHQIWKGLQPGLRQREGIPDLKPELLRLSGKDVFFTNYVV